MRARSLVGGLVFSTLVACGSPPAVESDSGTASEQAGQGREDAGGIDSGFDGGFDGGFDAGTDAGLDAGTDAGVFLPDPVLFIHGINGNASSWATLRARLVDAGWPATRLVAKTFPDPSMGCNLDNASLVSTWVAELQTATGAARVDLVAHSMGTLSSRYYMKNIGGSAHVGTYVTLGGMHHGLSSPCLSPLNVCVWKELCSTGPYVAQLNSAPVTPGPARWVSIYSTGDTTVPADSSYLDGGENIVFSGVTHEGLQQDEGVFLEVKRVLSYP